MAKVWDFFENMNEVVYVSDMETYDMIYMNKKALKVAGVSSPDEVKGKKCYEVMKKMGSPCTICVKDGLMEGHFKEIHHYDPIEDKYLNLKCTLVEDMGKKCRMVMALDTGITEQNLRKANRYENLESMANQGFRLALKAPTPGMALEIILEYLGKLLKAERTYIFEHNDRGNDDNTYEWCAAGVEPFLDKLQNLPGEVCANWYRCFSEDKNIIIRDLEETKEEDPLQYENLKSQGIHSLVVVPLYDDDKIIGFYGADNPPVEALEYTTDMLQIVSVFMVAALRRRNLLRQFIRMSHHDQLTGLGNRYAMTEYVEKLRKGNSLGVIFCDITGLKRVNDTEGHKAGDGLILRAKECLEKVFSHHGLFRVGGDEMIVLCTGISENYMQRKITRLKENMPDYNVVMALGMDWHEGDDIDLDAMLDTAEKRMYKDKAEYYKKTGIERRQ